MAEVADPRPPLVVILGPTAVGKTEFALELAERLGGEIVSADSRLFYRGLDIGTAKPSAAERRRVPHHLIDVAAPDDSWSLARFQAAARAAVEAIQGCGRLPLLVGGTGQYLRAVTDGWTPPAVAPQSALRAALEAWGVQLGGEALHRRLARLDPAAAAQIDWHNVRRTVRALEVIFVTGARFSDQRQAGPGPYRLWRIGLTRPRAELYARIDARIDAMLAAGWLAETADLLAQGYAPDLPSLSAIGYREMVAHLQGRMSYAEAVAAVKHQTRVFVRRQANWFKLDDPAIHWYTPRADLAQELAPRLRAWQRGEAS